MEIHPTQDVWPAYGLVLKGSGLTHARWQPWRPAVRKGNEVQLPFTEKMTIVATGEPSDNKVRKITVWAVGGFEGRQIYSTEKKSAIRGGS